MAAYSPSAGVAKAGIEIKLDQVQWLRAQGLLAGVKNGSRRVVMRATNKTLAGVRTDSVKEIRQEVNLSATVVRKTMYVEKATLRDLRAAVRSRQKYGTSLIAFGARQTRKGVTVQVKKGRPRELIEHAFIRYGQKGGGKQVFWRTGSLKRHVGTRPHKRTFPYGALPRRYRLPIKKLWGPAVPDIMSNEDRMRSIQKKANARLDKNFAHELDYLLSKV